MKFSLGPDGEIFWANESFCRWTGYTLNELVEMGSNKLRVDHDGINADLTAMIDIVDGYTQSCSYQTQYIPKNGKPEWGTLTAIRYPAAGELTCFLCGFEPLKNGTATAFALAVDHVKEAKNEMAELAKEIRKLSHVNEDEDWIIKTVRIARRYPKIAVAFIIFALSIFGANNILQLLQRIGWLGIELPKSVQTYDPVEIPIAEQMSDIHIVTHGGTVIDWNRNAESRLFRVGNCTPCTGSDCAGLDSSARRSLDGTGGQSDGIGGLPERRF